VIGDRQGEIKIHGHLELMQRWSESESYIVFSSASGTSEGDIVDAPTTNDVLLGRGGKCTACMQE
jgi:hypothetical protein